MLVAVCFGARPGGAAALAFPRDGLDTCFVQGPGEGSLSGRREMAGPGISWAGGLGRPGSTGAFLGARTMDLGF